jgi:hypothetical protein
VSWWWGAERSRGGEAEMERWISDGERRGRRGRGEGDGAREQVRVSRPFFALF